MVVTSRKKRFTSSLIEYPPARDEPFRGALL
jgi:hypothetical protein